MKTSTLKTIVSMMGVASDDVTRYSITCVHAKTTGKQTALTATNGHILCSRVVDDALPEGEWAFHKSELAGIKLILKEVKNFSEVEANLDGKALEIGQFTKVRIQKAESYPDYRQVIPGSPRHPVSLAFNPEYLVDMFKALEGGKQPKVRIEFDLANPLAPFRVFVDDGGEYDAVIMPMRNSKNDIVSQQAKALTYAVDALKCANAALNQAKTFPADVELARNAIKMAVVQ